MLLNIFILKCSFKKCSQTELLVCLSGRIFQKVINSYKHPNYAVSSSNKTPNCMNIRNIFDISDNRHLRV